MIPSLAVFIGLIGVAHAQETGEEPVSEGPTVDEPVPDDSLSPFRADFDVLADRAIGTTSRPVEFNWRRSKIQLAVQGNHFFELNTFNSLRVGALARIPSNGWMLEAGVSYADTWDSAASRTLELTPYRHAGRPDRMDIDIGVGLPLAEGIVTTFPRWFPAVQMVFNGYVGFRYHLYPHAFGGMRVGQVARNLFSPQLSQDEIDNLDRHRLDAMRVDQGRYGVLVGFGNDLYFKQGIFLNPRLMVGVPLFAPVSNTELLFYADLSLAIGVAL